MKIKKILIMLLFCVAIVLMNLEVLAVENVKKIELMESGIKQFIFLIV